MTMPTMEAALGIAPTQPPTTYRFYDGEVTVTYDDGEHSYTRFDKDGLPVLIPGVTSAVHIIDKSGPLTQWAANKATEYIGDKIEQERALFVAATGSDEGFSIPAETVLGWLDAARFNFNEYKNAASDTGKVAHDYVEKWIKALIRECHDTLAALTANPPEDERARNGATAALAWMKHHNVRWIFTERKIYSRAFDYAGTADGLALIDSCDDAECCGRVNMQTGVRELVVFRDALALIDWKTSNRLYEEYDYQTAAYLKAIEEENNRWLILYRVVIRLGKEDAQFESRLLFNDTLDRDFDIFLKCLALYRELDGRKRRDREVRNTVKGILKAAKEAAIEAEKLRKKNLKQFIKWSRETLYDICRAEGMTVKASKSVVSVTFKALLANEEPEEEEIEEAMAA
jgi:hypothetical protein